MKEELKKMLKSDEWPAAVDPSLICDQHSEEHKQERAEGILDLIGTNLKGKNFLDFGCGEGHCVKAAANHGARAVGFDIHQQWEPDPNLTTDWARVRAKGPYDIILVYDVIDHCLNPEGEYPEWWRELPALTLGRCRDTLLPEGKIYMTGHPWTSRHATHCYQQLNKAYIHWFFTEDELREMGCEPIPTRTNNHHPIPGYADIIKGSQLRIIERDIQESDVEPFFWQPIFHEYYEKTYAHSGDPAARNGQPFWEFQLRQQFHHYVLKR